MTKSNILKNISDQITNLAEEIKNDIAFLYTNEDKGEKIKSQKDLAESLFKITNIIQSLKKLEKIYDEDGCGDYDNDQKILLEFIEKIRKNTLEQINE